MVMGRQSDIYLCTIRMLTPRKINKVMAMLFIVLSFILNLESNLEFISTKSSISTIKIKKILGTHKLML